MDLTTTYLGRRLRNPLVASASPLSYTLDGIRQLAESGVGAIVMFSLFEEQIRERAMQVTRIVDGPAESFPEALSYFPEAVDDDMGPHRYLHLLERAVARTDIPVIASLNGVTMQGWVGYARAMQDAGAAAIELNIYYLPGDPRIPGAEVEQLHLDVLVTDLAQAGRRVVELGARPLTDVLDPGPHEWRIFADPAGHPFCLVTTC